MKSSFKDDRGQWDKIIKGTRLVEDIPDLSVGFFDEENAMKALYNEFGTAEIEERPFMRTALDSNRDGYFTEYQKGITAVIEGRSKPIAPAAKLGVRVRNDIIDSIIGGSWAPNKPSTVEAKGFDNPLVNTGAMQRAVTFKVGAGEGD